MYVKQFESKSNPSLLNKQIMEENHTKKKSIKTPIKKNTKTIRTATAKKLKQIVERNESSEIIQAVASEHCENINRVSAHIRVLGSAQLFPVVPFDQLQKDMPVQIFPAENCDQSVPENDSDVICSEKDLNEFFLEEDLNEICSELHADGTFPQEYQPLSDSSLLGLILEGENALF